MTIKSHAADDAVAYTTKVMAEEYNVWLVDGTTSYVDADSISLDDTSTVGDVTVGNNAAWTLTSSDYMIYVVDDDGFVTDVYLVNAA